MGLVAWNKRDDDDVNDNDDPMVDWLIDRVTYSSA